MKKIADQKLKAFSIGSMGNRSMSKRELEEMKKREQEQAAAQVFEEFVATFEEAPGNKVNKTWIKAGTYDAGKRQEDSKDKGKIYRPTPKIDTEKPSAQRTDDYSRNLSDKRPEKPKKKRDGEKKKTNLELFKEELKMIQEEREERHKYKGVIKCALDEPELSKSLLLEESKMGSFDNGDPNTTNLYLGNLNPKITEQQLMEVFGKYGPLASIKIMWPRSDEEKARGRNCGFVAYMSRKDGERALRCLNGKDVMQYEMKLGWGKGVPIPPFPIYVPPKLLALTMPPPQSGLPFNAQPPSRERNKILKCRIQDMSPEEEEKFHKILRHCVVKVVVPTDRNLLMLIHHMIEFVIREGPMFEAMIMNKEINNPMFRFLFENQSPAHIYYRWKLFSMLQGDNPKEWKTSEFRMFKDGSIWRPPPMNPFVNGMPEELVEEEVDLRKGTLSVTQRERLEELLRNITPERLKVAEGMVFCIEHADAAEEICECILESLSNLSTVLYKKVGRLYLVSDILHNCGVKISNASFFRKALEYRLIRIFEETRKTYENIESRIKAEGFRTRIMQILKAWNDWAIYPKEFLIRIQNTFLGLSSLVGAYDGSDGESDDRINTLEYGSKGVDDSEIDGAPLSESVDADDIDGVPLDGTTLLRGAMKHRTPGARNFFNDDIDGVPLDDDLDGVPLEDDSISHSKQKTLFDRSAAFVPSRWETVNPEEAEAQAMTTSKWELLEQHTMSATTSQDSQDSQQDSSELQDDSNKNSILSQDDRRAKLREIELKVMQYQDELESGKRILKAGSTIHQQVEHYRRKLLRKAEKVEKTDPSNKNRDRLRKSPSYEDYGSSHRSKRSRSYSASPPLIGKRSYRSRSGSRSPPCKSQKSWSPAHRSGSKRSRGYSPTSPRYRRRGGSPETPALKRRMVSPDTAYSHKKRSPNSPITRSRFRDSPGSPSGSARSRHRIRRSTSPSPSRHRHSRQHSPSSPSRKYKHKHKY